MAALAGRRDRYARMIRKNQWHTQCVAGAPTGQVSTADLRRAVISIGFSIWRLSERVPLKSKIPIVIEQRRSQPLAFKESVHSAPERGSRTLT